MWGFEPRIPELICMCHILIPDSIPHPYPKYHATAQIQFLNQNNSDIIKITKQTFKPQYGTELKRGPRNWGHPELKLKFGETPKIIHINASLMCKYKKQIILFQVDLNWIQHCKSWFDLLYQNWKFFCPSRYERSLVSVVLYSDRWTYCCVCSQHR